MSESPPDDHRPTAVVIAVYAAVVSLCSWAWVLTDTPGDLNTAITVASVQYGLGYLLFIAAVAWYRRSP